MKGSKDVFARYKADGKTVLGMVNTDMAGYSPSGKISIWTDNVDQPLTAYVRLVAEAYSGRETTRDTCGSKACSDHNSAMSNGFREFFFFFFFLFPSLFSFLFVFFCFPFSV